MSISGTVLIAILLITRTKADSNEQERYAYSNGDIVASTVQFQDIFSSSVSMLSEEPSSITKDDDYHVHSIPTQFVEFHPHTTLASTEQTLNDDFRITSIFDDTIHNSKATLKAPSANVTKKITVPKEEPMKHERGILDLLLPPQRVRTFKSIFDAFRRVLSNTFK